MLHIGVGGLETTERIPLDERWGRKPIPAPWGTHDLEGEEKPKQANEDVLEIWRLLLSLGDFFLSILLGWGWTVINISDYCSINTHLCPDKLITATDNQISNFLIQRNSSHLLNNTITQNINILFWEFKNIK